MQRLSIRRQLLLLMVAVIMLCQVVPTQAASAAPRRWPFPFPFMRPTYCSVYSIGGSIGDKWRRMGAGAGPLGCPITSERRTVRNWIVRDFENGAIFHNGHAEYAVYGAIWQQYKHDGRENFWGPPSTDEQPLSDGSGRVSDFDLGSIVWHPDGRIDRRYARYRVALSKYTIVQIRSAHADTNHLYIAALKGTTPLASNYQWRGDESGRHPYQTADLGVTLYLNDVNLNAMYTLHYEILNNGHNDSDYLKTVFQATAAAIAAKVKAEGGAAAAAVSGAALGSAVGTVVGFGVGAAIGLAIGAVFDAGIGLLWANCDGPIADFTLSPNAIQLAQMTENRGVFTQEVHHLGTTTNKGCGDNSDYWVTWTLQRLDP